MSLQVSLEYAFPSDRLGTLDGSSLVPLYAQLAVRISALIHEMGEYAVGKALPPEAECAQVFGVSRPTVRQAMASLLSQGLIEREKGRGTFVTRPKLSHDIGHDFDDDMRLAAHSMSYRLLAWERITPSQILARIFASVGTPDLYHLKRLRSVDQEVVGIEERYIPAAIASEVPRKALEKQSIFVLLRHAQAEPIALIDIEVSSQVADRGMARLLGIKAGAPLLVRTSTLRGQSGRPLAHGTTTFIAEHYTFRFTARYSRALP
jgi:GntR family transcriptional regulator